MKELLKKLEEAEQRANKADATWEQDPENEEFESEFVEAYAKQIKAEENLIKAISESTSGKIDEKTARKMIKEHRTELKKRIF